MRILKHVMALPVAELIGAPTLNGSSKKSNGSSGGSPSGGKQITVAFVPTLQGLPYFAAVTTCGQKAVEDLDFNEIYKGPVVAGPDASALLNRVTLRRGGDQ